MFKNTYCCDEVFLQTILIHSPFFKNLYHQDFDNDQHAIMRLIDWDRGTPYVFRSSDWQEIQNSDLLFARKFDPEIDSEIIEKIASKYGS